MFANSIIAQSQNLQSGSSTVTNPLATVTTGSDCGCGGSSYQGLIASSQKVSDCGCDGHEEDNTTQEQRGFPPSFSGGSGTFVDCYTVANWERTETMDDMASGNVPGKINISYQFKGYTQDCYTWNQGSSVPVDVTPFDYTPPFEEKTPNCPDCLAYKKYYEAMKRSITQGTPYQGDAVGTRLLEELRQNFDNMLYGLRRSFQTYGIEPKLYKMYEQSINRILQKATEEHKKEYDELLLLFLQTIIDGVTDENVANKQTNVCKSFITIRYDVLNQKNDAVKFDTFNQFEIFPMERQLIEDYPYFKPIRTGSYYGSIAIGLGKNTGPACEKETYKLFSYDTLTEEWFQPNRKPYYRIIR